MQRLLLFALGFLNLASAQVTVTANGTFLCALPNATYCNGASLSNPIIIRCTNGIGQPGNCDDNLAGIPPAGVKTTAFCYQSSPTDGDAACSFNGTVYPDVGSPYPIPSASATSPTVPKSTDSPTMTVTGILTTINATAASVSPYVSYASSASPTASVSTYVPYGSSSASPAASVSRYVSNAAFSVCPTTSISPHVSYSSSPASLTASVSPYISYSPCSVSSTAAVSTPLTITPPLRLSSASAVAASTTCTTTKASNTLLSTATSVVIVTPTSGGGTSSATQAGSSASGSPSSFTGAAARATAGVQAVIQAVGLGVAGVVVVL